MALTLLLASEFALLTGFLLWRKIPRSLFFNILLLSTWLYFLGFAIGLKLVDLAAPRLTDGTLPCLLPIFPVCLFVAWALQKAKNAAEWTMPTGSSRRS